jgi:hypothetical protein
MTTASEWAIAGTVDLGKGLSVEFTLGPGGFTAEWHPDVPNPKSLTKKQMARYRAGRDALVNDVAKRMGVNALVVEV